MSESSTGVTMTAELKEKGRPLLPGCSNFNRLHNVLRDEKPFRSPSHREMPDSARTQPAFSLAGLDVWFGWMSGCTCFSPPAYVFIRKEFNAHTS